MGETTPPSESPPAIAEDSALFDLRVVVVDRVLVVLQPALPRAFAKHTKKTPGLLALRERVRARPRIAAYLASERRLAFNEHGIFRHYPELDLAK